jgi:hypothetical protein
VLAVDLLRGTPGPVSGTVSPVTTTVPAAQPPSTPTGSIPTPTSPGFPSPPPGAVVFAREAGVYGLGLGIVPGAKTSLVRVSVLSPEGGGQKGLTVAFHAGSETVRMPACGDGCYEAHVLSSALGGRVQVTLGQRAYAFTLPASLRLPSGSAIVSRASRVWRALTSLVWHERLAASPTEVLYTVYTAVAEHSLGYTISDGARAIIIGTTRWDQSRPGGAWIRSAQNPPVTQPRPYWAAVSVARVIRSTTVAGKSAWDVTFFDPITPAWFEAQIDKQTGRTLTLQMITTAHFMHHVYGPFDKPIRLHPPTT